MPIEDDANAAASLFVRDIYPDAAEDLRRHQAYSTLARAVIEPAPAEMLVTRMAAFLFHYRDIIRDLAGSTPEDMWIGFVAPSAAPTWRALCKAADAEHDVHTTRP